MLIVPNCYPQAVYFVPKKKVKQQGLQYIPLMPES